MPEVSDHGRPRPETVLVPLLVVVALVTGVVDAVSFLALDHVFVGNMTGNLVFLGFALAGAPEVSASASLVALGAFLCGAFVVGWLSRSGGRALLAPVLTAEVGLCAIATVIAVTADGTTARYAMTVLLALAMGGQNAIVRRLAVRDVPTTNVLTTTLTALAADHPDIGGRGSHAARRAAIVLAMLAGALVGALLVLNASLEWALGLATALLCGVAVLAARRA